MFSLNQMTYSFKRLFTNDLFFLLSFLSFCLTIFISLGINVNSPDFFKPSNSFYKKASKEAFIAVIDNDDAKIFQQQTKDYLFFQKLLSQFNQEKDTFEKNNKGKIFPKKFTHTIVPEPLEPTPFAISLSEYQKKEQNFSLIITDGLVFNYDKNISCVFEYTPKDKVQESTCSLNYSYNIFKDTYKTKYKVIDPKKEEALKKNKNSKKEDNAFANTPFPLINNFQPKIEKNIIFGNITLLSITGLFFSLFCLLVISFFKKQNN